MYTHALLFLLGALFVYPSPLSESLPSTPARAADAINERQLTSDAQQASANVFLGSAGPYVDTLTNSAGQDLRVVFWSAGSSAATPDLTVSLPKGASTNVSFSATFSGAYAAIYTDTSLSAQGQIENTWVEVTTGASGVFAVSREVDSQGHGVSVVAAGSCTSNLSTCAFLCSSSAATSCEASGSYQLVNCALGSQPGVTQGGCKIAKKLTTTFKT